LQDEFGLDYKDKPEPVANLITWVFEEGTFKPTAKLTDIGHGNQSIITDYLGTPVQMYDSIGHVTWDAEFDIYGKNRSFAKGSLTDCPFRFQCLSEETGLYYNRFRYYDADMGGYLSQDPIGLVGNNPTLYGYVKDVNSWVDVFGLIIVYRAINSGQRAAVSAGSSIQPKNPNANYSVQNYVENGRLETQYISTTKDIKRAQFYSNNKSPIIAIDTDKIDPKKVMDISNGIDPQTGKPLKGKAFGWATKDAEVLIDGEIPKGTYEIIDGCL
jgi:RHS repeat-associated protein